MFTQLLTVHGLLDDGWRIPFAYGLLPGKTQVLYTKLLEQLDTFGPFQPDTVLCDYERALQNAVLSIWPSKTIRGCYFHFKQCFWRKFSQSDLVPEYLSSSWIRNQKRFPDDMGSPFLPLDDVDRAYVY